MLRLHVIISPLSLSSFLSSSLALTLVMEIFPSQGEARGGKFLHSSLSLSHVRVHVRESKSLISFSLPLSSPLSPAHVHSCT